MNRPTKVAAMPMPERIQRKRTRGWRMPEGAIYVGRLLVVERAHKDASGAWMWLCRCDCARYVHVRGATLKAGRTSACHSCAATARSTTHGGAGTDLYSRWRDKPGVWLEPGHVYQRVREIMRENNTRPTDDYQALCDSKAAEDEDPAVTAQRRAAIRAFAEAKKNFGRPADDPQRIAELVARQREAAPPLPPDQWADGDA
ncbi:hypothetical protein PBI_SQUIRTY_82 [Mycobacterium phage Squirty]|uniref:Uncharacterized protein n=1 Tax=Mycobacterium phage Squirty TaxID=1527512 RepID=A0A088FBR9_9CAUD|nr:hypothetical protein PBI_SQUIRTY_82 [Mycobacterium phage Squirty]AIM41029.1 hypothetical protein PBI_SQUIRTY_82 [Mycobacterium phage Squirty]